MNAPIDLFHWYTLFSQYRSCANPQVVCSLKRVHADIFMHACALFKGLAKLGNIVADANISQFSRAGNMCCGNKFCCSGTKNVFAMESKTFLLPGHKCCVRKICFPV